MPEAGMIDSWSIYAENTGQIYLQVFREISPSEYMVVGENFFTVNQNGAIVTLSVPVTEKIFFLEGDYIGWTFSGNTNVFGWDIDNSIHLRYRRYTATLGVGSISYPNEDLHRAYSVGANVTLVPEPTTLILLMTGILGLLRRMV